MSGENHFERNRTIEAYLPRAIDHPHPTARDFLKEFVIAEITNSWICDFIVLRLGRCIEGQSKQTSRAIARRAVAGEFRPTLRTCCQRWHVKSFECAPPVTAPKLGNGYTQSRRTFAPPTRCCRRPVGRTSASLLSRQDASSTLWFMEERAAHSSRSAWDHAPRRLAEARSGPRVCDPQQSRFTESSHGILENLLAEHGKEITQFLINLSWIGHHLCNLVANQFTIALAHSVHGHFDCSFAHGE